VWSRKGRKEEQKKTTERRKAGKNSDRERSPTNLETGKGRMEI